MNLRSPGVIGGVLVGLGLQLLTIAPALAAAPTGSISSPGAEATSNNVTIAGEIRMERGRVLDPVRVEVTSLNGHPGASFTVAGNRQSVPFNQTVNLPFNGQYRVVVTATGRDPLPDLNGDETGTVRRDFVVVAPPAVPAGVRAEAGGDRVVTISWNRNTEPDLVGYQVQRQINGGGFATFTSTAATSVRDDSTTGGGEFGYRVVAIRRGATGSEGVSSNPSTVAAASVAPPPTTTTAPPTTTTTGSTTTPTTQGGSPQEQTSGNAGGGNTTTSTPQTTTGPAPTPGTKPAAAPGTTSTTAPLLARAGKVDLSGFSSLLDRAKRNSASTTTTDPGFQETLPFRPGASPTSTSPEEDEEEDGAGEIELTSPAGSDDGAADRQRSMAFLAGGLLATVLLMHVLWLKGEVARADLEPLAPAPPPPARPRRRRKAEASEAGEEDLLPPPPPPAPADEPVVRRPRRERTKTSVG